MRGNCPMSLMLKRGSRAMQAHNEASLSNSFFKDISDSSALQRVPLKPKQQDHERVREAPRAAAAKCGIPLRAHRVGVQERRQRLASLQYGLGRIAPRAIEKLQQW